MTDEYDHEPPTPPEGAEPSPAGTPVGEAGEPYRPVFSPLIRTIIYVVCLLASIVALGFAIFHADPRIGEFVATAAGLLSAGFGVAYNPNRNI